MKQLGSALPDSTPSCAQRQVAFHLASQREDFDRPTRARFGRPDDVNLGLRVDVHHQMRGRCVVRTSRTLSSPSFALLFLTACSGASEVSSPRPGVSSAELAAAVTGAAAANIANGAFQLAPAPPDESPTLTETQARYFAELLATQSGWMIGDDLQAQHGGPIEFKSLKACGPSLYARSPFQHIPDELPSSLRYYYSAFWIVALCDRSGMRAVSVAVASIATDISVDSRGNLLPSAGAFRMIGIPAAWQSAIPASPEGAAVLAAQRTGRRVTTVPILFAPNPVDAFPQGALWSFDIDAEVGLRGATSGSSLQTRRVLVGSAPIAANSMLRGPVGLYMERPAGRRSLPFQWNLPAGTISGVLLVQLDGVLDVEEATVIGGGR